MPVLLSRCEALAPSFLPSWSVPDSLWRRLTTRGPIINGLAANEAPTGQMAQSLVLFSLSYFVGVFGFPLLAGKVIVNYGMPALLYIILVIALCNWSITLARIVWRRTMAMA